MQQVLLAMVSMAFRDAAGTFMVIAEERGRKWLAGALNAAGDLAVVLTTLYGVGSVIQRGWTPHALVVIAAMMVVSFFGNALWTQLGQRIRRRPDDAAPEPDSTR